MKLKTIGIIGTTIGLIAGISGLGIMLGGGFMTDKMELLGSKVKIGTGIFNYWEIDGKDKKSTSAFWSDYQAAKKGNKDAIGDSILLSGDLFIVGTTLFVFFILLAIASGIVWYLKRFD